MKSIFNTLFLLILSSLILFSCSQESITMTKSLQNEVTSEQIVSVDGTTRSLNQYRKLIWSDEFNSKLDTTKWNFITGYGGDGWGNDEWQYYRKENASIENGSLVIKATRSGTPGKRNGTVFSARMDSRGKFDVAHGRIEARIKMNIKQGMWTAFWMLGKSIGDLGWPQCGEIDIMEAVNGTNNVLGTTHWWEGFHAQYGSNTNVNIALYHTYAVEWDSTYIRWFIDGVQFHVIDITPAGLSELQKNFYIILNMACGGMLAADPVASSFPSYMYVDYVRVYKLGTGITEGTYYLVSKYQAANRLHANNNEVNIGTGTGDYVKWKVIRLSDAIYRFDNVGNPTDTKRLHAYPGNGLSVGEEEAFDVDLGPTSWTGENTKWKIIVIGNGYCRIEHLPTGKWLRYDGKTVHLADNTSTGDWTQWKFVKP